MSFLDRFKNSEFASVRHHATMAEKEFKSAIIINNDVLPEELQTHDQWEADDRDGHHYTEENPDGGKFYGTDLLTIERRMAKMKKEESEHKRAKRTRQSRLESYAEQWDANESIEYHEDDNKFHTNAVLFLRLVLSEEEFEQFEEEVEATL